MMMITLSLTTNMLLNRLIAFLKHTFKARSRYSVHSPFVYAFVTKVLPGKTFPFRDQLKKLRKKHLQNNSIIEIEDFGAGYGGKKQTNIKKSVKSVAKSSARAAKHGELLYRICEFYQPQNCLELGTNLGFSTIYQALALKNASFTTIEGSSAIYELAKKNFTEFNLQVHAINNTFDSALDKLLNIKNKHFDYVFIDGHHEEAATIRYFQRILPQMSENSIMIFDDIHWSKGMESAWNFIQNHPKVSISIDLFQMGICFVKRKQVKQQFRFRIT